MAVFRNYSSFYASPLTPLQIQFFVLFSEYLSLSQHMHVCWIPPNPIIESECLHGLLSSHEPSTNVVEGTARAGVDTRPASISLCKLYLVWKHSRGSVRC